VLYLEIIKELVEKRKYRSQTDFVNEAIKEKLEREGVDLEPKKNHGAYKDWCE
jgi:Arc/MetJ-type ribon-helix-helix transcriptional regulator